MGTLYLVRHGQASFGADNYDQLSPMGHRQALRLGEFWRERGMVFDAADGVDTVGSGFDNHV